MKQSFFSSDAIRGRESADYLHENTLHHRFLFGSDDPSETTFSLDEKKSPFAPTSKEKRKI